MDKQVGVVSPESATEIDEHDVGEFAGALSMTYGPQIEYGIQLDQEHGGVVTRLTYLGSQVYPIEVQVQIPGTAESNQAWAKLYSITNFSVQDGADNSLTDPDSLRNCLELLQTFDRSMLQQIEQGLNEWQPEELIEKLEKQISSKEDELKRLRSDLEAMKGGAEVSYEVAFNKKHTLSHRPEERVTIKVGKASNLSSAIKMAVDQYQDDVGQTSRWNDLEVTVLLPNGTRSKIDSFVTDTFAGRIMDGELSPL